jgi:hypothetical protein
MMKIPPSRRRGGWDTTFGEKQIGEGADKSRILPLA